MSTILVEIALEQLTSFHSFAMLKGGRELHYRTVFKFSNRLSSIVAGILIAAVVSDDSKTSCEVDNEHHVWWSQQ